MEHIAEEYANIQKDLSNREEQISSKLEESTKVSDNIFNNIKKFQHEEHQYLNILQSFNHNTI